MSTNYKHIIVAVELHSKWDKTVAKKAVELAKLYEAELTMVHAVEYISSYGMTQAYPGIVEVEQELVESARKGLKRIGDEFSIAAKHQIVEMGPPKLVLINQAEKLKADLIVVGSHGRHGIQLLLGSTANAVIHHAHCDVLAVRIAE